MGEAAADCSPIPHRPIRDIGRYEAQEPTRRIVNPPILDFSVRDPSAEGYRFRALLYRLSLFAAAYIVQKPRLCQPQVLLRTQGLAARIHFPLAIGTREQRNRRSEIAWLFVIECNGFHAIFA